MPELSEDLGSPYPFASKLRAFRLAESVTWEVSFIFHGPDGRYNPGYARIAKEDVHLLLDILKQAALRAELIMDQLFDGCYTEDLGSIPGGLSFELESKRGDTCLKIWIHNDTRWRFSRSIAHKDFNQAIEVAASISLRGSILESSLKKIIPEQATDFARRQSPVVDSIILPERLSEKDGNSTDLAKSDSQAQSYDDWNERYKEIRSEKARARCKEKSILLGVCSGLLAQAIHNKLTLTKEVRVKPDKYLAIIRLKFIACSLFFGVGILAYFMLYFYERRILDSIADFDDALILSNEEKEEARLYGWDV